MLSEVKERLEGPKYNNDFGGKGLGYAKRGHSTEVSQHFRPHCRLQQHGLFASFMLFLHERRNGQTTSFLERKNLLQVYLRRSF